MRDGLVETEGGTVCGSFKRGVWGFKGLPYGADTAGDGRFRPAAALATTPADDLLKLPMLQPDQVTDPLNAYQLAKRGNSLRVMAEAVRWGERGARINTISPGIIFTPLARDELTGPRGEGNRRMIELCPAGRGVLMEGRPRTYGLEYQAT